MCAHSSPGLSAVSLHCVSLKLQYLLICRMSHSFYAQTVHYASVSGHRTSYLWWRWHSATREPSIIKHECFRSKHQQAFILLDLMFQRDILLPSSVSKSKPSREVARSWPQAEYVLVLGLPLAGSFLSLIFDPEDGVGMFLTLSQESTLQFSSTWTIQG
jgi:hypothetical protein